VSEPASSTWRSVESLDRRLDVFPLGWNFNVFSGLQRKALLSDNTPYALNNTTVCAPVGPTDRIRARQGNPAHFYFSFRKLVHATEVCGTSAPSGVTMAPTTVLPSVQPTTSTPTAQPSVQPSFSSPTSVPTTKPSVCQPGTVTCCFTMHSALVQLYVDQVDVTAHVSPANAFAHTQTTKHLAFPEPSGPVAFAIKGFENNEVRLGVMALRCQSTTPDSPWNFDSSPGTGPLSWKSVEALDLRLNEFPPDWYVNEYTGRKKPAEGGNLDATVQIDASCGPPPTHQVRGNQGNPASFFWTLRRYVNGTRCG
jgi:hypothetical protein